MPAARPLVHTYVATKARRGDAARWQSIFTAEFPEAAHLAIGVDGTAVQGHDLPAAALITFGEAWHGNHHAWPESARLGVLPGQADPGWWVLVTLRRAGLAWNLNQPGDLVPRIGLRRLDASPPREALRQEIDQQPDPRHMAHALVRQQP